MLVYFPVWVDVRREEYVDRQTLIVVFFVGFASFMDVQTKRFG